MDNNVACQIQRDPNYIPVALRAFVSFIVPLASFVAAVEAIAKGLPCASDNNSPNPRVWQMR
jgi:hypothetical protein